MMKSPLPLAFYELRYRGRHGQQRVTITVESDEAAKRLALMASADAQEVEVWHRDRFVCRVHGRERSGR